MAKIDYKKNAILAAVAAFGGGAINQFVGSWIAKIPMTDKVFVGITIGGALASYAALLIYDYAKNR